MIGASIFQDAYAQIDCNSAALEANSFYVGDNVGILHKIDITPFTPATCPVGEMRQDPGGDGVFEKLVICQDIGLDPTDTTTPSGQSQLYCLAFGNELHKVDRLPTVGVGPGGSDIIKTVEIGMRIEDASDNSAISVANALEIDAFGVAYMAAAGNQGGKFYNLDLTTALATLRTDFNLVPGVARGQVYDSSGDLARDEFTTSDMYWTVLCAGLDTGTDDCGADDTLDRLFKITLNGGSGNPGEQDSIAPLAVLPKGSVFGMEIVQAPSSAINLCYITSNGFLFETDTSGTVTRTALLVEPLVRGFGAAANFVGGTLVMIDMMALALAAAGTNSAWLILFAISGAAVVAYQFKDKIKSKKQKNNV